MNLLRALASARAEGEPIGITSVCSAHPVVIEAALRQAAEDGTEALIEATCNQVNHEGGYTGMTPADFRAFVHGIAREIGFGLDRLLLGGDHLGPNPWRHLPADEAMARAEIMVASYAEAGFQKLHLDCSMGCAGEPAALDEIVAAGRAARLAARAELSSGGCELLYVIGTEVPTPGGAIGGLDHLTPTRPEAVLDTCVIHQRAFCEQGVEAAWKRVIAVVVQPGVEFGHDRVAIYRPEAAQALSASLDRMPGLVFEAHSTDFQPEACLVRLVQDGFSILKVGPALTFAWREALYALDEIASVMRPGRVRLADVMEVLMLREPRHWQSHYHGDATAQRMLRHYAYSDRIRYYWTSSEARAAVDGIMRAFDGITIPEPLVSQFLPLLYDRVRDGSIKAVAPTLVMEAVRDVLRVYGRAGRLPSGRFERPTR